MNAQNTNNQNEEYVLYVDKWDIWSNMYLMDEEDLSYTRNINKAKLFKTENEAISFMMKKSLEDMVLVGKKENLI